MSWLRFHIKTLSLMIFMLVLVAVGYPATVSASYGDIPKELPEDQHQYINLSAVKYLPTSWLKVYGDNNNAKELEVDLIDRGVGIQAACRGYSIDIVLYDGSVPARSIGTLSPTRGCTGEPGYTPYKFTIPQGSLARTGVPGRANIWEGTIKFQLVTSSAEKTPSFHAKMTGSGRLGYKGQKGVTIYPSAAGSTASPDCCKGKPPPQDHVIKARFKAPCSNSASRERFSWRDLDRGIAPQPSGTPNVTMREYTEGGAYVGNASSGNIVYNGDSGGISFDSRPGYKYELVIAQVTGGNGINLIYPFDSADYDIDCPPPDPPPSQVDGECNRIIVNAPSNRYYKIYVNDKGTPGTVSGTPDYAGNTGGGTFTKYLDADNKIVSGILQYTVIIYNGDNAQSGRASTTEQSKGPCYTAKCTIDVIENVPGAPNGSGAVKAGQLFDVSVTVTNTGINNLPATLSTGNNLAATLNLEGGKWSPPQGESIGGFGPVRMYPLSGSVSPGATRYMPFQLTAPNDMSSHALQMYPDYWNILPMGSICNGPVNTYQRYEFTAQAQSSLNDPESPESASHDTRITRTGAVDVVGTSKRIFYKLRDGVLTQVGGPYNQTRDFGTVPYSDTYVIDPPGSYQLGDKYCVYIELDRGFGWRGPGYADYYNEGPASANSCGSGLPPESCTAGSICEETSGVENLPYVRAYGEDVVAGGGFGTSCNRTNSGIMAFMSKPSEQKPFDGTDKSDRSGSGAQLAAMALGPISGFTSASLRGNPPILTKGLTFAHDNSPPSDTTNPLLGGNTEGNGWCMPDYFASTQFTDPDKKEVSTSTARINTMSFNGDDKQYKQTVRNVGNGKVEIQGSPSLNYKGHHTVYVDGDAYITGDIGYISNYGASIANIPSFTLVVRGNIYISRDVSRIDGLYIAQPHPDRPSNSGRIYTCATSSGSPITNPTAMFSQCGADEDDDRRQLIVNGAFLADRIVLNRTGYSLRDSRHKEPANNSKAAEIFNFSPEIYLSPPVFKPNGTATSGEYDYISILAPIL